MRKTDEKGNVVQIFDFNSLNCVFFFNNLTNKANTVMFFQ